MSSDSRPGEVLLVSSAPDLNSETLATELRSLSLELSRIESVSEARQHFQLRGLPVLMIVDLYAETAEVLAFCRKLHELAGLPVIVLSSDGNSNGEAVSALPYADSYLRRQETQPQELKARISAILRRYSNLGYSGGSDIRLHDWLVVNLINQQIIADGKTVKLTPIENAILFVLLTHRGRSVETTVLQERIWGVMPAPEGLNALRVHVHRLRNKIERDPDNPQTLLTDRGRGYTLTMA